MNLNMFEIIPINLLIHEVLHGLIVLPSAYYIFKKTNSMKLLALVILVTYMIDIDHLIDYFIFYGFTFNFSDFLRGSQFVTDKALIILHGWEYVILILYLSKNRRLKWVAFSIILGYIPHLILDTLNVGDVKLYILSYRLLMYFR